MQARRRVGRVAVGGALASASLGVVVLLGAMATSSPAQVENASGTLARPATAEAVVIIPAEPAEGEPAFDESPAELSSESAEKEPGSEGRVTLPEEGASHPPRPETAPEPSIEAAPPLEAPRPRKSPRNLDADGAEQKSAPLSQGASSPPATFALATRTKTAVKEAEPSAQPRSAEGPGAAMNAAPESPGRDRGWIVPFAPARSELPSSGL